jgi:hypothetical protein
MPPSGYRLCEGWGSLWLPGRMRRDRGADAVALSFRTDDSFKSFRHKYLGTIAGSSYPDQGQILYLFSALLGRNSL